MRWRVGKRGTRSICVLLVLLTGCTASAFDADPALHHTTERRVDPRPLQIHVLKIDLQSPDQELAVLLADDPDGAGVAEAALTKPMDLARRDERVIAAVNTNAFSAVGRPKGAPAPAWTEKLHVDIHGWARSGQRQASPAEKGYWCFWVDEQRRPHIGDIDAAEQAVVAVAGFKELLHDGVVTAKVDKVLHPRTAVGFDKTERYLYLVAVDGRQKGYSEGMSLVELAGLMKELGCHNALNLDGGGSTIMLVADKSGKVQIVNRPAAVGTRPIPAMLAVRRKR